MSGGHYLGIDGGGTKTEAVVLDGAGNELARAAGGPSNVHSAGQTTTEASLRDVILQVLERAALTVNGVTAVGLGMAGVDRPGDREMVHDILTRIARFPNVIITNDAEAALVGGVGHRHGVVLIAGTGAFAYGVNARGETGRADGWGYLLGDEGSAYWIGAEGLRAIARAHDGRGPATELTEALLEHLELSDATHLVTRVYAAGFGVPQLAGLAPVVSQVARQGDATAHHLLRQAGLRLSDALKAVITGLDMMNETFELVLTGGVLLSRDLVWETVVTTVGQIAPKAQAIEPRNDAAVGAALLAQQLGG